jgi:hypothetical protein
MIGIDFDNTIVCYDALFHRVARERGLIPADLPVNKSDVRNHLRRAGQEDIWTEMQGYVYGARMAEAEPYPGALDFFHNCRQAGIPVCIISHKTRHPFLGERHDLHLAARQWLEQQGFFDPRKIGLDRGQVFLELTKQAKIERIAQNGCAQFIDDLPELLAEPSFPNIERILFDPNNLYSAETKFFRALSWREIWQKLACPAKPSGSATSCLKASGGASSREPLTSQRTTHLQESGDSLEASPKQEIKSVAVSHGEFLARHGFGNAAITPLAGGGNNRVYRVQEAARDAVLKQYFQHPTDPRDRFGAESAFYHYVWSHGIRRTPEPLAWDSERRLGLFSFVGGKKLAPGEVGPEAVNQALEFILELNQSRKQAAQEIAQAASEACFSGAAHLERIDQRVARLDRIEPATPLDHEAIEFVQTRLQPAWQTARAHICQNYGDLAKPLEPPQSILSPSDFGFHNALPDSAGRLHFIDFEYAGWDDPAKLICDFFCQPQVPVPREFWNSFVSRLIAGLNLEPALAQRARLLWPAFQIKWCCIMLNEFALGDKARRDFAKGAATAEERKAAQLFKARQALQVAVEIPSH